MLKILLALLYALDAAVLLLLIYLFFVFLKYGDVNILLPGLGLIVSLQGLLVLFFVIEIVLVTISIILSRYAERPFA